MATPGFGPRPACCPPALPGSILRSLPTASSVAAAASLLCTAARPLIVVGKGAAISPGAAEEVRDGGAFSLGVQQKRCGMGGGALSLGVQQKRCEGWGGLVAGGGSSNR